MKALVTGACGFVGGYLTRELQGNGHTVLGALYSEKHNCPTETVPLDITSREDCLKVLSAFKPDIVYHLAGMSFVPAAQKHFDKALETNVYGVYNILDALSELGLTSQFVLASSGEVYGIVRPEDLPLTELSPVRPANAYSLSKAMAEDTVRYFMRRSNSRCYIMRPFNHIGPGQNESFVTASFASQIASIAAGKSEPVMKVGNLEAVRDFMDVRDVVRAYAEVHTSEPGTYNLSSGSSVSIQAILDILLDISGVDVDVQQDPERMRPSEVPEVQGSFDKAYLTFGWKPEIDIETSLKDIYQSWLSYHQQKG